MSWVDQALADIRVGEALKLEAYWDDIGKCWTNGYGHTKGVTEGQIVSQEQADSWLAEDFAVACADLDTHAPWWKITPDAVRRGLVNMVFNLGWPRFSGFENLIECGIHGDYAGMSAAALDSKWATQVGDRAKHIAALFNSAAHEVAA